jgi:hypothetical protein
MKDATFYKIYNEKKISTKKETNDNDDDENAPVTPMKSSKRNSKVDSVDDDDDNNVIDDLAIELEEAQKDLSEQLRKSGKKTKKHNENDTSLMSKVKNFLTPKKGLRDVPSAGAIPSTDIPPNLAKLPLPPPPPKQNKKVPLPPPPPPPPDTDAQKKQVGRPKKDKGKEKEVKTDSNVDHQKALEDAIKHPKLKKADTTKPATTKPTTTTKKSNSEVMLDELKDSVKQPKLKKATDRKLKAKDNTQTPQQKAQQELEEAILKRKNQMNPDAPQDNDNDNNDQNWDDTKKGEGNNDGGLYDYEINKVMKSYRSKGYLGTFSYDEVADISKLVNPSMKTVSFIYNTDKSTGKGKHWRAVFIKLNDSVEHYDSYGDDPTPYFNVMIKKVIDKMKPKMMMKYKINRIQEQGSITSSDCGYFCMAFLMDRYNNIPFKECTGYSNVMKSAKKIKIYKNKINKKFDLI